MPRTRVPSRWLIGLAALTTAMCAACGEDPTLRRATERCVQEAQKLDEASRKSVEADCHKAQSYCDSRTRRKEPLCQKYLERYQ